MKTLVILCSIMYMTTCTPEESNTANASVEYLGGCTKFMVSKLNNDDKKLFQIIYGEYTPLDSTLNFSILITKNSEYYIIKQAEIIEHGYITISLLNQNIEMISGPEYLLGTNYFCDEILYNYRTNIKYKLVCKCFF